jgi:peroxisomal enoyl-CoA hydratase 2
VVDWSRGVDGERYIEIIKPIPTTSQGKKFELRRETVGAYDKGKAGLVLEEQTLLVDAGSGETYTKMVGSAFFVGQVCLRYFYFDKGWIRRSQRAQETKL